MEGTFHACVAKRARLQPAPVGRLRGNFQKSADHRFTRRQGWFLALAGGFGGGAKTAREVLVGPVSRPSVPDGPQSPHLEAPTGAI